MGSISLSRLDLLLRKGRTLLDRLCGLDFLTTINPQDVGLNARQVNRSTPSGSRYLARVLRDLKVTADDSILDVGCGKGSAMRSMLRFPFGRIDGIELSEHIAAIAERNFEKLKAGGVRVFVADAARFAGYDDYNMVYLYNPFPASVMAHVVDALIESVSRSERELVVIYNNAKCHDLVVGRGVFVRKRVYPSEWGTGINLYSNRDGEGSRVAGST